MYDPPFVLMNKDNGRESLHMPHSFVESCCVVKPMPNARNRSASGSVKGIDSSQETTQQILHFSVKRIPYRKDPFQMNIVVALGFILTVAFKSVAQDSGQ